MPVIRAAFRLAAPRALTVLEIFGLIKKNQLWRIDVSRGQNKEVAAKVDSDVAPIVGHAGH